LAFFTTVSLWLGFQEQEPMKIEPNYHRFYLFDLAKPRMDYAVSEDWWNS